MHDTFSYYKIQFLAMSCITICINTKSIYSLFWTTKHFDIWIRKFYWKKLRSWCATITSYSKTSGVFSSLCSSYFHAYVFFILSFIVILHNFLFPKGEPEPECRRYIQVRNITKGDCRLENVEVSFCRGRCLSRTDVILEVQTCKHIQYFDKRCFLHSLLKLLILVIQVFFSGCLT